MHRAHTAQDIEILMSIIIWSNLWFNCHKIADKRLVVRVIMLWQEK